MGHQFNLDSSFIEIEDLYHHLGRNLLCRITPDWSIIRRIILIDQTILVHVMKTN